MEPNIDRYELPQHRKRSVSPDHNDKSGWKRSRRSRSRSHHRHHHEQSKPKHHRLDISLPYSQEPLRKRDLESYRHLFAEYLDVHKQLYLDVLSEQEAKGRWKSFVGKWNRCELAEGWYDPAMNKRAQERSHAQPLRKPTPKNEEDRYVELSRDVLEEDDTDAYGPALPGTSSTARPGPAIPNMHDLQLQREQDDEDRERRLGELRHERKLNRKEQKDQLEDLVPRAEPGSRERQLEKKRDAAASNRAFAEAKDAGDTEVADNDLMGEEGIDAYKVKLKARERQKNEREIRKEEVLRARAAEREEKLAEHRRKEETTMQMLRAIAQQRFGGGGET